MVQAALKYTAAVAAGAAAALFQDAVQHMSADFKVFLFQMAAATAVLCAVGAFLLGRIDRAGKAAKRVVCALRGCDVTGPTRVMVRGPSRLRVEYYCHYHGHAGSDANLVNLKGFTEALEVARGAVTVGCALPKSTVDSVRRISLRAEDQMPARLVREWAEVIAEAEALE